VNCYPAGSPSSFLIGYLATPSLQASVQLFPPRESLDLSKKNPVMIAMLSSEDFCAPSSADSVVLIPREWIWGSNDLEDGVSPLRYFVFDANRDGTRDVVFQFPRDALKDNTTNVAGVMLKGTTPDGDLLVGIRLLEILNQFPS
jgi:hypothetical protein